MRRSPRSGWAALGLIGMLSLSACGGSHPKPAGETATTPTATAPLTVSTSTGPVPTTPSTGSLAPAGPVPSGTVAASITFISPATAFVLGTAPCDAHPCSAILRTTDRGAHWVGLPAPRQAVSYPLGDGLWGLRFADSEHGYAFGQGLWETANGGRNWQRAMPPAPTVLALEAVQGREIVALAKSCRPAAGCGRSLGLYHRAIGGAWARVASVPSSSSAASISVHGPQVWVVAASRLYRSVDGGLTFSQQAQPCPTHGANFGQPTSITDDGSHVYLLCTGQGFTGHTLKYVYAAPALGGAWTLVGKPPSLGDGGQISAGSDSSILLATYSAATVLYRSSDGGHRWRTVLSESDGGAGWSDLGFTTTADAVVVHGPAVQDGAANGRPGKVLLSDNGGLSWRAASF